MNQIVKLFFDKVMALELNISDIPAKFKNDVVMELSKIGFLKQNNLDDIKEAKIEEMSAKCNEVITNGFNVVLSDGENYHFSLTVQDQLNLITLSSIAASSDEDNIPYHADGGLCKYYSAKDIVTIVNSATAYKTYHVTYFNSLKSYISSLNDINSVLAITYGIEIPNEYQSDILKELNLQAKG